MCHTTRIFLGTWGQSICSAVTVVTAGSLLLLAASGTILLALYCWTLQTFPFWSLTCFLCNKPLVGGLKPSEIQLYKKKKKLKKIPYWIAQFNLQWLYKERRTGQGTSHSKLCISFHSDKNLISWHYKFVVNACRLPILILNSRIDLRNSVHLRMPFLIKYFDFSQNSNWPGPLPKLVFPLNVLVPTLLIQQNSCSIFQDWNLILLEKYMLIKFNIYVCMCVYVFMYKYKYVFA